MCNIKKYFRADYLAHFIIPVILGEILFTIGYELANKPLTYILFVICILLGIFGKEFIWDKWAKQGTFEWADILIGCSGLAFVVIQWLFILI